MSEPSSTEDLADLYETAPCGYLSLSRDGSIVKVNGTLVAWLGMKSDELLGRSIHEILSFGGRIAFETHLAPLLRMQDHVHEIALDLVTSEGEKIPTIANAAEKRTPSGAHQFTRLTMFKAVDRRTYERSLLEAKLRAESDLDMQRKSQLVRDQFVAVLGHDLRNPLAAISAGTNLLRGETLSDRGKSILTEINNSASRASKLVDDVLDLARGTLGGGIEVDRNADAPLGPELEQVIAEIRAIAPEFRIDARLEIDEPVHCDRGRLGQLASNLLANAVTHGSTARPIEFRAVSSNDELVISVANAGDPIPEEVRDQLFLPFFRGKVQRSRHGLGLGLFIVSEIAKSHDGRIDVTSTADQTRFTFTMPLTPPVISA